MNVNNPTLLVAPFDTDLAATDLSGATTFVLGDGSPSFSDGQMHLDGDDAVYITTVGHLGPVKGSVSFVFTRSDDTGGDEYLLECGQDGEDWLRVYVDGVTDKLVLSWASGGALPQIAESEQVIALDQHYFVSCDWQHTAMGMRIGSGEKVVGLRDVPVGTWGASPLTLLASGTASFETGFYGGGAYGSGDYGDE